MVELLSYIYFISIGYSWVRYSIIIGIILFIGIKVKSKDSFLEMKRRYIYKTESFYLLLFFVSYYYFGYDNFQSKIDLLSIVNIVLNTFMCYYFGMLFAKDDISSIRIIFCVSIGLLLRTVYFTYYTYSYYPALFETRMLIDPLSNIEINSPSFSNDCLFSSVIATYYLVYRKVSILSKLFLVLVITIGIIEGIILAARTFFIIYFIVLGLFMLKDLMQYNYKKIAYFVVIVFALFIFYSSFVSDYLDIYASQINARFNDLGLESGRYELWYMGFINIFRYPFGSQGIPGLSGDASGSTWYHNYIFDTVKTSSILTLILLLIYQSYGMKSFFFYIWNPEKIMIIILFISTISIMFSSIPLESDIVIFVYFVLIQRILNNLYCIEYKNNKEGLAVE